MAFDAVYTRKYKNKIASIFLLSDGLDPAASKKIRTCLRENTH